MRVLVTGGAGRLGRKLLPELFWKGHEVVAIDVIPIPPQENHHWKSSALDITDSTAVDTYIQAIKPDVVINTVAMTNVDLCETEREKAYRINADVPAKLANICRKHDIYLIHVSTDFVFDGKAGPYPESALPNPISYYGRSKLAGENEVLGENRHFAVVRTCVLFGYEPETAPDFVTWLLSKLRHSEPVKIVTDQFSSPTLTDSLATGLRQMVEQTPSGIFHLVGKSYFSRFEMAIEIATIANLSKELIEPVDGSSFVQAAQRPKLGGLLPERAVRELGFNALTFQDAMKMYFSQEAVRN